MSKICIGYGNKEGKCNNEVDPKINPHWCPECNATRIDHIDKRFEKNDKRMAIIGSFLNVHKNDDMIELDKLMSDPEKLLEHIADIIDHGEVDQWSSDMLREMAHDFRIKKYRIASPNTFEIFEEDLHRLEQLGAYEDGEMESYDIGSKVRGTDKYNYWE